MSHRRILGDPPPDPFERDCPDPSSAARVRALRLMGASGRAAFVDEPDVDLEVSDGDAAWLQERADRLLTDLWYGGRVA